MSSVEHIENPDVILIGSGVMSATLGGVLKNLQPDLKIQLYEVTPELAHESSNGWNNAGTGHAGICELSYTPNRGADGEVDVAKAIEIFDQFEQSKYFWGYAVRSGMIKDPSRFVNAVPHIAFVYGHDTIRLAGEGSRISSAFIASTSRSGFVAATAEYPAQSAAAALRALSSV